MASIESLTDPLHESLIRVPLKWEDGICGTCHGAPSSRKFSECYSCYEATRGVTRPVPRVIPISLCPANGQLYRVLSTYKSCNRLRFQPVVAGLIGRFLKNHWDCVGREPDLLAVVPSTTSRQGEHPLAAAIKMLHPLGQRLRPLLSVGRQSCGHNKPSDTGFEAAEDVAGKHVLLVDDLYTSGARLHSAASVLQLAGAHLPAAVVVGRYMNPREGDLGAEVLAQAWDHRFDWRFCCACEPPF